MLGGRFMKIRWNKKEYNFDKHKSLYLCCIDLAKELGYRKELAIGTQIYNSLLNDKPNKWEK